MKWKIACSQPYRVRVAARHPDTPQRYGPVEAGELRQLNQILAQGKQLRLLAEVAGRAARYMRGRLPTCSMPLCTVALSAGSVGSEA